MPAKITLNSADDIITSLRSMGRQVRARGRRRWLAQCPAHDDNHHSLSVAEGDHVPFLVKCHAGCSFEKIIAVLSGQRPPVPLSGKSSSRGHRSRRFAGPVQWYDYRDEEGRLLYQHGRTADKEFPFRMPDARRWGLQPGVRRLLYRLPDLAAAATGTTVFVVEGEKDADRLAGLGLMATCNDSGAGKWPEGCDHHFEGLHVVILPDNDPAGEAHGEMVAARLAEVGASVRVVRLPDLPEKGDVSDWLDAGHRPEDLLLKCMLAPLWEDDGDRGLGLRNRGRQRRVDRWPEGPGGEPDGYVMTVWRRRENLAPVYESNGGYKVDPRQRHRWVLRHGRQVVAEAKAGPVYVLALSEAGYARFKYRQYYRRGRGERREWWAVPQIVDGGQWVVDSGEERGEDGGVGMVVFHNDPAEGGEAVPARKRALYRLVDGLVDGIPAGRNPKGTKDWGRDYRSSRGDGREKDEAAVVARAEMLLLSHEFMGEDVVAPYQGMAALTVREIKTQVPVASRRMVLGMLRDEVQGKQRKSVLVMLLRRTGSNAVQLWSRGSIGRAADTLEIRLDPETWRGTARMPAEEVYRRLAKAKLPLFARDGKRALDALLHALLEWEITLSLWDFEQPEKIDVIRPVRNPIAARGGKKVHYAQQPP